ncbi:hypothetical protein [Actinomadura madurae]|uniref:hypothetical protein n=1 Tax=Actinomadura madurae TaxID=1993 RepID=UPI0020D25741|nr:hypothetical protein [Actinomadura madurae]MCP9969479.1 hypothetical protein [Actinomadura madurae]MCQ0006539.1 hypothetical protein [Actinomadura madurae]
MLLDGMARPMGDGRPIDGNPGNLVHAKLARRPLGLGSLTRNRSRRGFPHGHRIVRGLRQDHLPHRHLARRLLRHGPDDPAHRFTLMDGRDRVPEHGRLRDDLGRRGGPLVGMRGLRRAPEEPARDQQPAENEQPPDGAARRRRDAAGR